MPSSLAAQTDTPFATQPGHLVIISGPSGSGKSTVTRRLRDVCELPLTTSISATTRQPRDGERHGVDYFFVSDEEFQAMRRRGEFLECKQVFAQGHWYGTLAEQVTTGLAGGKWVVLEIDVQGAMTIMDDPRFAPITIFIHPGNMRELERRLRDRGTETEDAILSRLKTAAGEMRSRDRYQHQIINITVDAAVKEICDLLDVESRSQTHPESTSQEPSPCSKN